MDGGRAWDDSDRLLRATGGWARAILAVSQGCNWVPAAWDGRWVRLSASWWVCLWVNGREAPRAHAAKAELTTRCTPATAAALVDWRPAPPPAETRPRGRNIGPHSALFPHRPPNRTRPASDLLAAMRASETAAVSLCGSRQRRREACTSAPRHEPTRLCEGPHACPRAETLLSCAEPLEPLPDTT